MRGEKQWVAGLADGTTIGLLVQGLALPVGLISAAFLTRRLGLDEYGLLGVVLSAVIPVAWATAGILAGPATVRLVAGANKPLSMAGQLIQLTFWIGAAVWLLFAALSPFVADWLGHPGLAGSLILAGAEILLLPLATAHRSALMGLGFYRRAGISNGVFHLARLGLVLILVGLGMSLEGAVLAAILARVAEIIWCRRRSNLPLHIPITVRFAAIWGLSASVFIYSLCDQTFHQIDILLLTAFGGSNAALGYFASAQLLAVVPRLFVLPIAIPATAAITRARAEGDMKSAAAVATQFDRVIMVMASLILASAGAAPSLCRYLFGEEFAAAAPLATWLLIGGAGNLLRTMAIAQLVAYDRHFLVLMIGLPMLGVAVLAHSLIIPGFQASGAAVVTGAVSLISSLAGVMILPAPRRPRLILLIKALFGGLLGFATAGFLGAAGLPLLDVVAGAAVAMAIMWITGVVGTQDVRRLYFSLINRPTSPDVWANSEQVHPGLVGVRSGGTSSYPGPPT